MEKVSAKDIERIIDDYGDMLFRLCLIMLGNSKTNINRELERITMNRRKEKRFLKRPLTIAATLVLCVCLTGFTALATSGKLQGFFKDITNWNGTVTGTEYEQATEEISISMVKTGEELNVLVTFANPEAVPYCEFEEFGIESYRIEDTSGNVIVDNNPTDMVKMNGEQLELSIPLEGIPNGNYKLIIDAFVGGKKAHQPLRLNGVWESEFVK